MRTADRAEHLDEHVQPANRRERVREQRDRHVAAGEPLAQAPRADDDGKQQRRPEHLGEEAAGQVVHRVQRADSSIRDRCSCASLGVSSGS